MSVKLDKKQPQSGYTPCACRDCMDTTVSSDVSKPELCTECRNACCVRWTEEEERNMRKWGFDCQREDAYGEC